MLHTIKDPVYQTAIYVITSNYSTGSGKMLDELRSDFSRVNKTGRDIICLETEAKEANAITVEIVAGKIAIIFFDPVKHIDISVVVHEAVHVTAFALSPLDVEFFSNQEVFAYYSQFVFKSVMKILNSGGLNT